MLIAPPSKSHTIRALLFALMAKGTSRICNYLVSPDTERMIQAIEALGAQVTKEEQDLIVIGTGGNLQKPLHPIDAGNSGQVLRFIAAIASLSPHPLSITGDCSLCSNRPIRPLVHALKQLGVQARHLQTEGFAPIELRGPLQPGTAILSGFDSQPVSGLLMACSFLQGATNLIIEDPREQPWINLTLHWLRKFGMVIEHQEYRRYHIPGHLSVDSFTTTIPGDFSSAAFPLIAGVITGKQLLLKNLPWNDPQGDKHLFSLLKERGISLNLAIDHLHLASQTTFLGGEIDVNPIIDAVPILAVLGCFGKYPTILRNAQPARLKESDRLLTIQTELTKMGAKITSCHDTLTIHPSSLHGAPLFSYHDHRIAMALAVAALGAKGHSTIQATDCIAKSFPGFVELMQKLGYNIESPSLDFLAIAGR
jgi:3-phosphoshikimate 1-carboxyvinyltransferase